MNGALPPPSHLCCFAWRAEIFFTTVGSTGAELITYVYSDLQGQCPSEVFLVDAEDVPVSIQAAEGSKGQQSQVCLEEEGEVSEEALSFLCWVTLSGEIQLPCHKDIQAAQWGDAFCKELRPPISILPFS